MTPDPKEGEDSKETDAEPGEDLFNCTKSKRNAEDLKDVNNPGELEEAGDERGRDEFRDRVPSFRDQVPSFRDLVPSVT